MFFREVIASSSLKNQLIQGVKENRISHAQLFMGNEGSANLVLALAYAQFIHCEQKQGEDACGTCSSCIKHSKLVHPDLHFVFPVSTTTKITKTPHCNDFLSEWRSAVLTHPYMNLFDWMEELGVENKQGIINAEESGEIIKKLNLKTFEAAYKIMLIWLPEKMHASAANKLLKILEEPPDNTVFLLVTQERERILPTILSRTQLVKVSNPPESEVARVLVEKFSFTNERATQISNLCDGNIREAILHAQSTDEDTEDFLLFQQWMRHCYQNKFQEILHWVDEIAGRGRERQKNFILYALHLIRQSFLLHMNQTTLVKLSAGEKDFAQKFSPFIHTTNCPLFFKELNDAYIAVERNANPRILFLHVSLRFFEWLRMKEA